MRFRETIISLLITDMVYEIKRYINVTITILHLKCTTKAPLASEPMVVLTKRNFAAWAAEIFRQATPISKFQSHRTNWALPHARVEYTHSCSLGPVSLLDPRWPTYEALYYCWGDPADPGIMSCQSKGEAMKKDDKEDMGIPVSVLDYEGVRGKNGLIWINQNFWAALFRLCLETQTAVERARNM